MYKMVTIFSVPKPFTGRFKIIQRNAITSWTYQKSNPEIILLGSEKGTKEICRELKIRHIPDISYNSFNTPLLHNIFLKSKREAKNDIFCFILADVILLNDISTVISGVRKKFKEFLIIGRRFEADINYPISFNKLNWKNHITQNYILKNKPKRANWMDYFIFSKGIYDIIPKFAIGRTFWDKWLVWSALNRNIPVIDATGSITAVHQTHDYSHIIGGKNGVWQGNEAQENIRLAGGWSHGNDIDSATYKIFNNGKIKNASSVSLKIKILIQKYVRKIFDMFPPNHNLLLRLRLIQKNIIEKI